MIGMLRRLIAVFMTLFAFFPWEATAVSPMQAEQPDAVRLNVSILASIAPRVSIPARRASCRSRS